MPVLFKPWMLFLGLALAGLALLAWSADELPWRDTRAAQAPDPIANAQRRDLEVFIESSGDIQPRVQIEVKSEVGGRIEKILVEVGDSVAKGQPLVKIDDRELIAEKASAETDVVGARLTLEQARRDFQRAERLFARKLIPQEEIDRLRTDLQVSENNYRRSEHRLSQVEERLAKTTIPSPLDGTVLSLPVEEGQVVVPAASVNAGTLIMTIADLSNKIIKCHINQVDITQVVPDQDVAFTVSSMRAEPMKGRVERVAPMATVVNNVKGFEVLVVITEENGRLKPGMTADLRFQVAKANQVLTVPVSAIFYDEENRSVVYVKGQQPEQFEKRQVEVGLSNFDYAEIKSGLQEGDAALLVKPEILAATKRS